MLTRIPFLSAHSKKEIRTMKTTLSGVILAGLLVVAGALKPRRNLLRQALTAPVE